MLDNGVESMGMAHRGYDKYGKRMWMADPQKDTSTKDRSIPADRSAGNGGGVDGGTTRTNVGI